MQEGKRAWIMQAEKDKMVIDGILSRRTEVRSRNVEKMGGAEDDRQLLAEQEELFLRGCYIGARIHYTESLYEALRWLPDPEIRGPAGKMVEAILEATYCIDEEIAGLMPRTRA